MAKTKIGNKVLGASLVSLLFLFITQVFALRATAGVLTGELDKSSGTIDEQFFYTLSIQGKFKGEPTFPKVEGLEVAGTNRSQSVSVVNGRMSSEMVYQFVLTTEKAGTYTIPPIKLKVDDKDLETLPLELKVEASGSPSSSSTPSPSAQGGGGRVIGDSSTGVIVERSFTKTKLYVGETIGVKVKVSIPARAKVVSAHPDFKYPSSFQVKTLDKQKNYTEERNGETYNVTELDAMLTANREGVVSIDPAILIARIAMPRRGRPRGFFDDFMMNDVREKKIRSEASELTVLPLPAEGRRKDFSGLVGIFQVEGELAPRSGQLGDTLNLTLKVSGQGSAAAMAEPELPFGGKLAKIYKDKADYQEVFDETHGVNSQKTFRYAIVPLKAGDYPLGKITIQTFNPEMGSYQDIAFDLGDVSIEGTNSAAAVGAVSPSQTAPNSGPDTSGEEGEVSPQTVQRKVEIKAQDLIEPHPTEDLKSPGNLAGQDWNNGAIAFGLSMSGLVAAYAFKRKREPKDDKARLAKRAFKHCRKKLDFAEQCIKKHELGLALREAQACFKEYAGAKFGAVAAAVTLRDIEAHLRERKVSRETLHELRELWGALDQMIYAPPLGQDPSRGEELLGKARKVLEQVERQCRQV